MKYKTIEGEKKKKSQIVSKALLKLLENSLENSTIVHSACIARKVMFLFVSMEASRDTKDKINTI